MEEQLTTPFDFGLNLHDYFAAKAMQATMSNAEMWRAICMDRNNNTRDKENDSVEDYVAQECYKMADAMMRERKNRNR